MEVVTITNSKILRLETELIKSVYSHERINGESPNIIASRLMNFLDCIADTSTTKTLYALSLLRLTTPYNLKDLLHEPSRDPIVNRLRKAVNAGLVDIITKGDPQYRQLSQYWKNTHPTTNKKSTLYIPTPDLYHIIDMLESYVKDLLTTTQVRIMKRLGDKFTEEYSKILARARKKDRDRMSDVIESIGACSRCGKDLTKTHEKTKQCEKFYNELYCKPCLSEMKSDGTISRIVAKNGNGKR